MEELELEEGRTVKRLSDFIPSDLRMKIFGVVKERYKNGNGNVFERDIGLNLQDIIKGGDAFNEYFPRIFAFALTNLPQVREVIRKDFLEEIESLCRDLGISGEGKIVGTGRRKNNLERFMEHIDGKSREIIWYLLRNRYAGIRDLSDLVGASADTEVLTRIREVINPTARKYLRKEIMEFKESEVDESSGKKVAFKWWLMDKPLQGLRVSPSCKPFQGFRGCGQSPRCGGMDGARDGAEPHSLQLTEKREEMLDVFDEGDKIRIIAELPPAVEEKNIKVLVNEDIVGIIANASKGKYERKVPLFYAVEKAMEKTYKNRILEVRLIKKKRES
ncbi:MAG: hypothetical protein KAT65_06950 [Methanophagales archaeon]|nr:hypothetical protein [Methanophagales archaeon]